MRYKAQGVDVGPGIPPLASPWSRGPIAYITREAHTAGGDGIGLVSPGGDTEIEPAKTALRAHVGIGGPQSVVNHALVVHAGRR